MSYADAIRPVRNKMRKFSYASVLRSLPEYRSTFRLHVALVTGRTFLRRLKNGG